MSATPTAPPSVYASSLTPDQRAYIRSYCVQELNATYDTISLYKKEADAEIARLTARIAELEDKISHFLSSSERTKTLIITRAAIVDFMNKEGIK